MTLNGSTDPLADLILSHSKLSASRPSPFSDLRFYANFRPNRRKPVIYQPGLVMVAKGEKRAHSGERTLPYNSENMLILTAPMPIECEVVAATPEEPFLAVVIPLVPNIFLKLSADLKLAPNSKRVEPGIASSPLESDLKLATIRFLQTLLSEEKTAALGEAHLRELYYYVLASTSGERIKAYLASEGQTQALARVLKFVQDNIGETFSVEHLAGLANLSSSAFHRAFKNYTSDSPLRYIKKMKLHKAYSLMHYEGLPVSQAARTVGYQSPSQFSREFKRVFGKSPTELLKENKQN